MKCCNGKIVESSRLKSMITQIKALMMTCQKSAIKRGSIIIIAITLDRLWLTWGKQAFVGSRTGWRCRKNNKWLRGAEFTCFVLLRVKPHGGQVRVTAHAGNKSWILTFSPYGYIYISGYIYETNSSACFPSNVLKMRKKNPVFRAFCFMMETRSSMLGSTNIINPALWWTTETSIVYQCPRRNNSILLYDAPSGFHPCNHIKCRRNGLS